MTIFVQPMQPPLEQPLRGRPTGPIYVTLVESTLFDGMPQSQQPLAKEVNDRKSNLTLFLEDSFVRV